MGAQHHGTMEGVPDDGAGAQLLSKDGGEERRTPGRKGRDEGWISQRLLEKETVIFCAPLSLLKRMRDLVGLVHEILSIKSLGGS